MRKFTANDYSLIKELSGLVLSPSGKHAVYSVRSMNVEEDRYEYHLWLLDLTSEKSFQLTQGKSEFGPFWLDDQRILFTAIRDLKQNKETVLFCIDIQGGEAYEYMRIPLQGAKVSKIDPERYLVRVTEAMEEKTDTEKWVTYTEYPFEEDGGSIASQMRRSIYLWDNSSKELKKLTEREMNTTMPYFSDDVLLSEQGFYFVGSSYTVDMKGRTGLYYYDFTAAKTTELFSDRCYIFAIAKYNGKVWFGKYDLHRGADMAVIDILSMDEKTRGSWKTHSFPWQLGSVKQGFDQLLFLKEEKADTEICRLTEQGKIEVLPTPNLRPTSAVPVQDQILFLAKTYNGMNEVYKRDAEGKVTQLTFHTAPLYEQVEFSKPVYLETTNEGRTIPGWVIAPVGYEAGKNYPGILTVHGGPHGHFNADLNYDHQRLASEGYFVFYCNPTGSTTYGKEHQNISGDMGGRDYRDMLAFTEKVLETYPDLDAQKLAVTGQSYGGYMSNWMIGQTDLFKAAISRMSISNWISLHGTSMENWYAEAALNGTPWDHLDELWRMSPIRYANKVKAPTLFIQHENDRACPLEQAEQMFSALCGFGIPTKLIINKGTGHGGRSVKQLIHDIDCMTEWLKEYL